MQDGLAGRNMKYEIISRKEESVHDDSSSDCVLVYASLQKQPLLIHCMEMCIRPGANFFSVDIETSETKG